jgi:Tol biopolymer transport system component
MAMSHVTTFQTISTDIVLEYKPFIAWRKPIMLISSRWLRLVGILSILLLAACNTLSIEAPSISAVSPTITPVSQDSLELSRPVKCQLPSSSGLPVGDEMKNSYVLYQAGPTVDRLDQIWVYDINDGSNKLVLNNLSYPYYQPGFLSDGLHIVMADEGRFWLSDLSGSSPKLVDGTAPELKSLLERFPKSSRIWHIYNNVDYSQAPDGNTSAVWNLGDPNLVIINRQTGKKVEVISYDNRGYIAGNWSPDGRVYVFTYSKGFQGEHSRIYMVNSDGTGLRLLAQYEGIDLGRPYWSPNGQKIVFTSHKHLQSRPTYYQVLSLNSGEIKTLAIDAEESLALRNGNDLIWSPDNQWILFTTQEYDIDHWKYEIKTLNINSGELYCIASDNLVKVIADWH